MYFRHYFMKNVKTGEIRITIEEPQFGEIGDRYDDWEIIDYAEDYCDEAEPIEY